MKVIVVPPVHVRLNQAENLLDQCFNLLAAKVPGSCGLLSEIEMFLADAVELGPQYTGTGA